MTPVTNEEEWLSALATLDVWTPPDAPIVLIAPHPDDETLGAGGLIAAQRQRGVAISVVAVTDGENAYGPNPALGATRRGEQARALARLGVAEDRILRLGLVDSDVAAGEDTLTEALLGITDAQTHLVAPWVGDFHPDHEACGRAAEAVARKTGAQLSFYLFWTWHRGVPALLDGLAPVAFPLSSALLAAKLAALACHQSQLVREDGEPILPEALLGPAQRPFEVFLPGRAQ